MVYERDFIGYGKNPPKFLWPGEKTLALSIVVNYEEGAEHSYPLDGIVETVGEFGAVDIKTRDVGMESVYEYGQRVGIWRLLDLFKKEKIKVTFFSVAKALELNREAAKRIMEDNHEICDHGYRWTELYRMTYEQEKEEIRKSVDLIEKITGKKPVGFYAREPSENTLEILKEFGNFIYDSDAYNDDLPYFYQKTGMLIIPYTPDVNDFHFLSPMHRFANSDDFFNYMKDTFNVLYKESKISPKLMNVGLHVRISGRPGRFVAIEKFIKYVKKYDIWIATREEIARFWIKNFKQ
ncbi:MAG: polysaccharide deacetylase family protein [Thermoplasmata archaeon]